MSAKISPRHRQAFLAVLAETGNYALAADQVRVSRDWVFKLRRRDAAFDTACRGAVAEARTALRYAAATSSAATQDERVSNRLGAGLVVQRGNGRRVQVKRARARQWTDELAARFLAALAGCCNVKLAAAEVGMSAYSAYYRRRRDPGFARAWAEAIEIGYARLEAGLVEAACCFFEGEVVPDDNPVRILSVAEAIQSLNRYNVAVKGVGGKPGRRAVTK